MLSRRCPGAGPAGGVSYCLRQYAVQLHLPWEAGPGQSLQPKSDKTERPGPEAEKEPKKAGPRKGRPSKADKAAPDKAQPSQRDKLSRSGGKAPEAPAPPDAGKDKPAKEAAPPEQGVTEPTVPPRPVEEGKLVYLKLSDLHPFHTFRPHPFKVRDDAKMQETVASIKLNGVMVPGLARPEKDGNGYEIVAGHRRCRGSELAGLEEMPFIVRDMTDHEAVEAMKDSNKQRDQTLPSELAALLDLEVEDIKHQGSRLKGVAEGDVGKRSVEIVGEAHGMNYKKVMRYLRLNHLVPELMDMPVFRFSRSGTVPLHILQKCNTSRPSRTVLSGAVFVPCKKLDKRTFQSACPNSF